MTKADKELVREIVKDGLVDLNDAVERLQLPGVSTAYSIGSFIAHRWEVRQFDRFLDRIRMRLDLDREQLLEAMRENKDKRWMAEGLARGWRLSLESMDDAARECAYFLVADYMAEEKPPDRMHRQVGNLLLEADEGALRVIRKISMAHKGRGGGYAFVSKSVARDQGEGPRRFSFDLQNGKDKCVPLDVENEAALQDACDLVIRAGFMSTWYSHMQTNHAREGFGVYKVFGEIKHHQADSWTSLHKYLAPVDSPK